MGDQRLLERINAMELNPRRRERADQGQMVDSILTHLRCLLNTRQGAVPIAADYGMPDLLDFLQRFPDSVREIELSIQRTIRLYEPRLDGVQVTFLPESEEKLSLRFRIQARMREAGFGRLNFETVVETDGKILVRR